MITEIGVKFPLTEQFGRQEHSIFNNIKNQINTKFPDSDNLIVNLTWFGPQFNNNQWGKIQQLINDGKKFDKLFWFCIVDPITILPNQLKEIENQLHIIDNYYIGPGFEGQQSFNTHAIVCYEDFPTYTHLDLTLADIKYLYLNYNRKPKPHRIELVELLHKNSLEKYGVITIGKNDVNYKVSGDKTTQLYLTIDDLTDYTRGGKFPKHSNFGGVPYDLCSLGRLDIWQTHFLNIVSETEFNPWDNLFVTEKTWKPIIGLRPFIINGQTKIYKYLRDNGFKTFNHYFNGIEIENIKEFEVHESIIKVVKYLTTLDNKDIFLMYNDMLPDLIYNRERFFEFAKEQQHKIDNLFI